LVTHLRAGQHATILQLPVQVKSAAETRVQAQTGALG
jgi:hypothetical protein